MSNHRAILLLSFVVLGIYYPAIFADVNSLDDDLMLEQVASLHLSDIATLFLTQSAYYRPLLMTSYVLDHRLLGQLTPVIHFENVLIHLVNVLLCYLLASRLFSDSKGRFPAFIAALLFAVHPLCVESVAWISGRTDLLCTTFILLSFLAIHRALMRKSVWWASASALMLFLGCLVKELAFFSIPAVMIFAAYLDASRESGYPWRPERILRIWAYLLPLFVVGIVYFFIRIFLSSINFIGYATKFTPSIDSAFESYLAVDALKYFGFYLKKLIWPYPLNFAIVQVPEIYAWFGAVALVVIVWVVAKKRIYSLAMVIILCILVSAIYVALKKVAWTPAAERYLYLTTLFWSVGIVDAIRQHLSSLAARKSFHVAAFVFVSLISMTTVQRLMVWQSNQALYEDTLKKTPDFAPIRNQLAIALVNENRYDEALRQIEIGKGNGLQGDKMLLYVNQALIEVEKKNYNRASEILKSTSNGPETAHPEVLKALINVNERRLVYGKKVESKMIRKELMTLHEIHYKRSRDLLHLYRTGQLALSLGDKDKAFACFSTVGSQAPEDAYFKKAAKKLALKTSPARTTSMNGEP